MAKQNASWGQRAEIYAQEHPASSSHNLFSRIEEQKSAVKKHTQPSKVHDTHPQTHAEYFQCEVCEHSIDTRSHHIIHWKIGAEAPLVCIGNSNQPQDEV